MCSEENPHYFPETPLLIEKIGIWFAVSRKCLNDTEELQNVFFQHDGATAHRVQTTLNFLREFYTIFKPCAYHRQLKSRNSRRV